MEITQNIGKQYRKRWQPRIKGKQRNLKNVVIGIDKKPEQMEITSTTEEFEIDEET